MTTVVRHGEPYDGPRSVVNGELYVGRRVGNPARSREPVKTGLVGGRKSSNDTRGHDEDAEWEWATIDGYVPSEGGDRWMASVPATTHGAGKRKRAAAAAPRRTVALL